MATLQTDETPSRVLGLYDRMFWDLLKEQRRMHLQCCSDCATWRYPPGPVCPRCLSPGAEWKPVSGEGELLSWVVFRRKYLPGYEPPYNVIAVLLDEGPTIVSNLIEDPEGGERIIGRRVRLVTAAMSDGIVLPRFVLLADPAKADA